MTTDSHELRYALLGRLLARVSAQPRLTQRCLRLALALEGGHYYSGSARKILQSRLGVAVGPYSYGQCFSPGYFQRNTVVGRYVSIGPGVRTYVRDHPTRTISTHPFFFNSSLGFVSEDTVPFGELVIGHDAWLGANVVVTSHCRRIGVGAVIAAGTLVTRDVPDFAVVGGNPGQFLRFRFSRELKQAILDSKWWELTPAQLSAALPDLALPLPADVEACHPLLRRIVSPHHARQ